jgi:cellulase/cellobiase CelA1
MKEKPSPVPRKQLVFSPKRSIALLLALTFALSFVLLFAPAGKATHTASAASLPTLPPTFSTPTPLPLDVTITSPANGSVFTLPAPISLVFQVSNFGAGSNPFSADFYATLEPNGPVSIYSVLLLTQQATFDTYTATWVPPQAGTYSLVAQAEFMYDPTVNQYGTSAPITVQVKAPTLGSCTVRYQLESQWAGGFNANVVVTNTSSVPISGWTLVFTFPGDQKITQLWNGTYTQTGQQVTITNLSYNRSIASGGTVNLGFNGSWVSNNTSPMLFTLNNMTCST